jgi:hypothetical protein
LESALIAPSRPSSFKILRCRDWLNPRGRRYFVLHLAEDRDNIRNDAIRVFKQFRFRYESPSSMGTKRISLEQLRKVLGLGSVKDTDGNIIQEAPLPVWANLRQRALDTAMTEITKKTDISIEIESLERSLHRRVTSLTFVIKAQALPDGDSKSKK